MQKDLRVVVADDHPLFRNGIADAVRRQANMELAAECADGPSALQALREHQPDVATLDLGLPGMHGRDVIRAAVEDGLPTRVVVVSGHVDASLVHATLSAGAAGYLSKQAAAEEITQALGEVAEGQTVLCREAQAALASRFRREHEEGRTLLTGREIGVLRLLADGLGAAQIGRELSISVTTVKSHLQHVYDKLGVSTAAGAVSQGIRRGMLD